MAKGRVDAVVAAHDRFAAAVNDVPDDATLAEAADSLRDEAANFQGALSDLVTEAEVLGPHFSGGPDVRLYILPTPRSRQRRIK